MKHIPTKDGGKTDYPRKYTSEGDQKYRESKLWDNLKKQQGTSKL